MNRYENYPPLCEARTCSALARYKLHDVHDIARPSAPYQLACGRHLTSMIDRRVIVRPLQ